MNKKFLVIGLLLSGVTFAPSSYALTISNDINTGQTIYTDGLTLTNNQSGQTIYADGLTLTNNQVGQSITTISSNRTSNYNANANYQSESYTSCNNGSCDTITNSTSCNTGCSRYRKSCLTGNRVKNYGERYVVPYGVTPGAIKLPAHLCGSKECLANRGFHRLLNLVRCRDITCKNRCQVYQQDEDNIIVARQIGSSCNCLVGTCNEDLFGNR